MGEYDDSPRKGDAEDENALVPASPDSEPSSAAGAALFAVLSAETIARFGLTFILCAPIAGFCAGAGVALFDWSYGITR